MFTSDAEPTIRFAVARVAAVAVLLASAAGCEDTRCGEGTIERNDRCVPAEGVSPETSSCGPGTEYSASDGTCVPLLPPTQCGPNTVPEVTEDGTVVCVGVGGGACDQPISCPLPEGDTATLCGQLRDAETGELLIEGQGGDVSPCDPDAPAADGPCALELFAYDAVPFATGQDPQPLAASEITIDRCGRFRVVGTPIPAAGIVAIVVDDSSRDDVDVVALSGIANGVAPGLRISGGDLLVVRRSTDAAWTSSAGDPFDGITFAEKGVALVTYRRGGSPQAGVTATISGNPNPDNDFYFLADEITRTTIDPAATSSGADGTALVVNVALEQLSGRGQEPEGCAWSTELAASPPNAVFIAERIPTNAGEECQ